ncbi:MAG TPA: type II secretion system F family protein [Opitutaceae bacterium]|jgi:type II secretory pathway component PulF|nr:type II secretion system F family protein [Opitutaceae bacterium]
MNVYRYRASSPAGRIISGMIEAESLAAIEHQLRRSGAWLLDAREERPGARVRRAGGRLKRPQLIAFFVEMSLLLRARITLPQALRQLADDYKGERWSASVGALHQQVTAGVPLHQAMAGQPGSFSPQIVAMVQAGEASGNLSEVFENLTAYQQWLDQLVSDIRQALIYPAIVMGATLALILGLFTFIVPRFIDLLQGISQRTPLPTRVVFAASQFLLNDWPVLLAAAAAAALALKLARGRPAWARTVDGALMRLPVFGPLIAMFALSRFAQNLGMLYRAGIPLLRGLEICRHLVGNRAIAAALEDVARGVAAGSPLSRSLARHPFFPPSLVTMIASGEASGSLEFSLRAVAGYYNTIIPRRIKAIFAIFNPAVMFVLIAVVGGVALAVVLPILELWQAR